MTLIAAKNQLHQTDGWRWLVDIDADGTNGYALTDGDVTVVYSGTTYQPYPFRIESIDAESDGSLPEVQMVFASVDGHIATRLGNGDVLDRRIRIRRVNLGDLTFAVDMGTWQALSAALDYQSATLVVGPYPLFDAPFPSVRQVRGRCPKVYGGPDCGYDLTRAGALATCDYGLETSNGCRAHGADELAAGVAVRHPARFGGFPGIPKGLRL